MNSPETAIMEQVYELEGFAERYNWVGVRYRAERILELIAGLPVQGAALAEAGQLHSVGTVDVKQ